MIGGKKKLNNGLKSWLAFVKKVQNEEHKKGNKISYKEAIMLAKKRKDKGEKWMKGGDDGDDGNDVNNGDDNVEDVNVDDDEMTGGRKSRKSRRKSRKSRRKSRRHRR
jgi:hypothetical protein